MELIRTDNSLTLKLTGRLDANNAPEVTDAIENETFDTLTVDMSGLEYISSAGLRALLVCKKTAATCGGSMVVGKPQDAVMEILSLSGFVKMLNIKPE